MAVQDSSEVQRTKTEPIYREVKDREVKDANPDPITGKPGAHPVGVGVGAATLGVAGAVAGSVIPGVGTIIGAAIGAIAGAIGGGYAGKGIAEVIDPTAEDAYWRENLSNRPYYNRQYTYEDDYGTAYGLGYAARAEDSNRTFEQAESDLRGKWEKSKGKSRLSWDQARHAVSDSWNRYTDLESKSGRTAEMRNRDLP